MVSDGGAAGLGLLRTGESTGVEFFIVLITLRRDEMPSRRSVMSTVFDSPVLRSWDGTADRP